MRAWPAVGVPELPGSGPGLRLYDSADRQVRPTAPGKTATMYVCGITPYDATHLGHAATYLTFDLVNRIWRDNGHRVHYVQNITDVDDPLFERAERDGIDWRDLGNRETDLFREDMAALRVLPPQDYVAATEAIAEVVGRFMRELPSLRERAVLEVFDRYRPRSDGYRSHKSNKVDRIGDKLVITRAVEQAFSRIGGFSLDYHRWVEIASLENVFAMLDGAPKVENELKAAICASPNGTGETRWFRFRCFRNGNLHLTFTRPDLVHEINRIGGASSLRSPDA